MDNNVINEKIIWENIRRNIEILTRGKKYYKGKKYRYDGIADELQDIFGIKIRGHTVRSWVRNKEKPSFPSLINMVALCKISGMSIEEFLGTDFPVKKDSLFEVICKPQNDNEKEMLKTILLIEEEYNKVKEEGEEEKYVQPAIKSFFDYDNSGEGRLNRHYFYHLLLSKLVKINAEHVKRSKKLENDLIDFFKIDGKSLLNEVYVYRLPNYYIDIDKESNTKKCFDGVSQFVFFAAAAEVFKKNLKPGDRIGLTGGRTMYSMMQRVPRFENIRNCVFFPILLKTGISFIAPITSEALVFETRFRFEDYDVNIPSELIEDKGYYKSYLQTANSLYFSVGNLKNSTFASILKNSVDVDLDVFAGDILFNLLTKDGYTLEEIINSPHLKNHSARESAEKIKNIPIYKNHIENGRIDLDEIFQYASKRNYLLNIIAGGENKAEVFKALKKYCERYFIRMKNNIESDKDITNLKLNLITECSLTNAILKENK